MFSRNPFNNFIAFCLVLVCFTSIRSFAEKTIYVSPSGNDSWSGKLPKASENDGPLASLEGAKRAVRKAGNTEPVRVVFAEGRYQLSNPIVFEPEDSRAPNSPAIYSAAKGAKPIFSGGRRITGFKLRGDGLWEVKIPDAAEGKWRFEQLWVNGKRATRARTPNTGYLRMSGLLGEGTNPVTGNEEDLSKLAFVASQSDFDLLSSLSKEETKNVEITTYSSWTTAKLKIAALDPKNSAVILSKAVGRDFREGNVGPPRYHLENYRDALDTPGEWFLSADGTLLYYPLAGEKIASAVVYAPVLEDFIIFKGDTETGKYVENMDFSGLHFEHSQFLLPDSGRASGQAESDLGAVFTLENARNIRFLDCSIKHIGRYAFWFRRGSRDSIIKRCLIEDMGAGGVKIGEMGVSPKETDLVRRITVDNNIIRGGGKVQTAGIGVIIFDSPDNKVIHNDISDFYYTAVSVGWRWGYGSSEAKNNQVDYNHLHHLGYGVLSDMGGVYTLGISPGTTVNNNVVHDVTAHSYGGWGLYNDEGSTDITLKNNLVFHCSTGGYHQHYGKNNHITNNIFAYNGPAQIIRTREEDHISFTFDRNIVLFDSDLLGSNWNGNNFVLDNNIYYNSKKIEFDFAGNSFADWQARGHDTHSIIADPLFINPKKLDFRLKPDSPASKIGFIPFDYTKAGVYGSKEWIALAKSYKYPKANIQHPTPLRTLNNDFESVPINSFPIAFGVVHKQNQGDKIYVTNETAASGKNSLKFVDKPGLQKNHLPHVEIRPERRDDSIIKCSFDVRVEEYAEFWHEWRDLTVTPYTIGPNVRIAHGRLVANGSNLMEIPLSTWTRITISCGIGKKYKGTWDLEVTVRGKEKRIFRDLPCGRGEMLQVNYINFVANADKDAVFYLDNIIFQ